MNPDLPAGISCPLAGRSVWGTRAALYTHRDGDCPDAADHTYRDRARQADHRGIEFRVRRIFLPPSPSAWDIGSSPCSGRAFRAPDGLPRRFGRAISEVGAVMIVGGNIDHLTRVMTTAIALETSKGDLELAMALGIILMLLALMVNLLLAFIRPAEAFGKKSAAATY